MTSDAFMNVHTALLQTLGGYPYLNRVKKIGNDQVSNSPLMLHPTCRPEPLTGKSVFLPLRSVIKMEKAGNQCKSSSLNPARC